MRIALDARMRFHSGVGTYLRGLFPALVRALPEVEWLAVQPADGRWRVAGAATVDCRVPPLSLREHWQLPRLLRREKVDLLFTPHFNVPAGWPVANSIAVIHDTIPLLFPRTFRAVVPPAFRYMAQRVLRGAAAVLTDSLATAAELRKLSARAVTVVYPGMDRPAPPAADEPLPEQYLFALGGKLHKNAAGAIELHRRLGGRGLSLLLRQAASEDGGAARRAAGQSPDRDRIHLVDRLSPGGLSAAYRQARLFVFLSYGEGFGYPPLEAMASDTPVLASKRGSLAEVLGDAALLVDPDDMAGAAAAAERLLTDETLRQACIGRGREAVRKYTWPAAAAQVVDIVRRIMTG